MSTTSPPFVRYVNSFQSLIDTEFSGQTNALCWQRELTGDFLEIVQKLQSNENMRVIDEATLLQLRLSDAGKAARHHVLNDLHLLQAHGADPVLNLINAYEPDTQHPLFPTDVYSFHVDRAPLPVSTFLCTYYGAASQLLANADAEQKIRIPEIRTALQTHYQGKVEEFETYLTEHFFDLHYRAKPQAQIVNCGTGHLWRLAVHHPESTVLPCIHRAPKENGEPRLLLIC